MEGHVHEAQRQHAGTNFCSADLSVFRDDPLTFYQHIGRFRFPLIDELTAIKQQGKPTAD